MKTGWSFFLLFLLVGCGGSSSDNVKGFSGQVIEGLEYRTSSKSATTDASGVFSCNENEEISFYVGTILLSTVTCRDNLTLFDLANMKAPMNQSEYKNRVDDGSMNKLMNLATFLQTIDEDADPSNGIVIPKEFSTLSKGITLDFKESYFTFKNSFNFRKLIHLGRSNNIWEEGRTIVNPRIALDKLYEVMNLQPEVYAVSSKHYQYTYNESNNSTYIFDEYGYAILNKLNEKSTFTYNDLGLRESSLVDKNSNGNIDFKNLYSYDKYGNLIGKDEYINDAVTIQFDSNGKAFYDFSEGNGSLLLYKKSEEHYNVDGNLISHQEEDVHYNLFFDTNRSYTYDEYGNTILEKRIISSNESYCYIYEYNNIGQKTLYEFDVNCDETIEGRTTYGYDQKNRLISTLYDDGVNGIVDRNYTVSYDTNGSKTFLYLTYDDNGNVDMNLSNVFDVNDNLLTSDFTSSFMNDGHHTYEYSNSGKVLFDKEYDADGLLIYLTHYIYDTHDSLLLRETKDIVKGEVVYKYVYTYDEKNNLLTFSTSGIGNYNYDETYTYDASGNILTYSRVDKEGENIRKTESIYTYINTGKWVSFYSYGEK